MIAGLLSALGLLGKATLWGIGLILCLTAIGLLTGFQAIATAFGFLAETWIIQTLFGAWVVFRLQEISLTNARKSERLRTAYDRKVDATKALYALIEKRIYASRRYLAVINDEPKQISAEREAYRQVVREWNETAKINQLPILLEFPAYFGLALDNTFFPDFLRIDDLLRRQRLRVEAGRQPSTETSADIRTRLAYLNQYAIDTVRDMLRNARRDRHVMDGTLEISMDNAPHLSYGRLFKALVEPAP